MTGLTTAAAAMGSTARESDSLSANVATLNVAYGRWSESKAKDTDCWAEIVAENVKFGSLSAGAALIANQNGGGRAGLCAFYETIAKYWSLLSFNIDEFIGDGDSVVMRGRIVWQHKRTGKVYSSVKLDYWQFRNGKAVEFFEVCDTAGIQAAASD